MSPRRSIKQSKVEETQQCGRYQAGEMEVKLLLIALVLLVQDSLAVWQNVTVIKGQTLHLRCPIRNAHKTTVEWRNPKDNIMFFNKNRVLRNPRYRIDRLSMSEFSVSVSNVTFTDGGVYTCSHYGHHMIEKKVRVTVLSLPKISVTQHEGRMAIKCSAEGNHWAPEISWKLDEGPEIFLQAQIYIEDHKYVSVNVLQINSVETRVTVKCLVRHPDLLSPALMNFIKVGQDAAKSQATTTISLPKTELLESTEALTVMPTESGHGKTTTVSLTTSDVNESPSVSHNKPSAVPSDHTRFSSSGPQTFTAPTVFPDDTSTATDSHFSPTDWTSMDQTTENLTFNNTERNDTVNLNDPDMRTGQTGSSTLLVFLVSCLILCLLVVVVFFGIKLRRAHIIWKKENEDSDPSEDSSKSKSSQEEQKRRGHLNTAFTQYVNEGPTLATVTNTGATTGSVRVNMEQMSQPQTSIKETEL